MNVLLIGDDNRMLDDLINKLNKNNHHVYWLTGKKWERVPRKPVFETYNFSYTNANIKDVFESAKPDVTLFTGAYDTGFDWKRNGQEETLRYVTAVINILTACSIVGGRFIYLSSQEVYDGSYADNIVETTAATARGFKASAVVQGEGICGNFRKNHGLNSVILRLDHIYGPPKKGQAGGDPCFEMCLEALRTGKVSANGRKKFSMLYLNDAVELIYHVVAKPETDYGRMDMTILTSISEGQPLTILESFASHTPVIATNVGNCRGLILGERDSYGAAGIVTRIMNIEEISNAILTLAWNEPLRRQMGETGYRRVVEHYQFSYMKQAYRDIYQRFADELLIPYAGKEREGALL